MYVNRKYGFWMTFNWSKKPFIIGFIYASIICAISYFLKVNISIPWQPISVIGIAVAFYLGFKNNSSYDRTWEARKIWGSIVNNSRSMAAAIIGFTQGDNETEVKKELIYRHLAWLTSHRHQSRLSRTWEHVNERVKGRFVPTVCEDYTNRLENELLQFISKEEYSKLKGKANIATQLLKIQSLRFQELRSTNYFDDFRHMQLQQLITNLYADQGKSERIKNFPFPRQYASAAIWLTIVFSIFVPLGINDIIEQHTSYVFLLSPFLSALIIWIFFLMEKTGDYSENPFEGTYNDVPITSIARGIEIDLREMIDDDFIPESIKTENGFLM